MNNLFEILKMLNSFGSQQKNTPQFNNHYYPNEAYNNHTINQSNFNENNMLPLLMSLMGKNNDLEKIFSQSINKKEEDFQKEKSSPKDEILL